VRPLSQPISIRQPEIGALIAGTMTTLLRPLGRLSVLQAGDLLWVREPFHLPKAFAHLKPTRATGHDVAPVYVADHDALWFARHAAELGRRQAARVLPKAWRRQHLVIAAIARLPLHDAAGEAAQLLAAGWKDRDAFIQRWDQDAAFGDARPAAPNRWASNPDILRISFVRVAAPLPGYDRAACAVTARSIRSQRGSAPPVGAAPFMRSHPEPDRTPCPRCNIRRDIGCKHFPLTKEVRP
jgi:hypothetical protein